MSPAADSAKIDWYRSPLDAETLKRLTRRSDARGWLQAGGFLLVFAATTASAFYFFSRRMWAPMILACYLHSIFQNFLGMAAAAHELSHSTVFKTKLFNEFFYKLFCFLTWNNPVHFRISHALHHQLTVFRGRDKEVVQAPVASKLNAWNWLFWCGFDPNAFKRFVGRAVLHALGRTEADYFSWDPLLPPGDPRHAALRRWSRLLLAGQLLLAALFIYFELWVLLYLITFGGFFGSLPAKLCGALQHSGLSESVPDWRLVCHSLRFGPLMSWLYWNMNYHTEHHMYAAVPFFNLKKLHRAVASDLPESTRGLLAGVRLLLEIKRRQKIDSAYVHVPVFPAGAAPPRFM